MPGTENSKERENLSEDEMNFRNAVVSKLAALQAENSSIKKYISGSNSRKTNAKRKIGATSFGVNRLQGLKKLGSSPND